jgi:uncharacterized membrane protein
MKRFDDIDILKGIAIICMIIFHYYYYPTQLGISGYDYNTNALYITAKVAQVIFILCSGMNLSISYENNKENIEEYYSKQQYRFLKLSLFALLLSYLSYLLVGSSFVKFGILHFMAAMALINYRFIYSQIYIHSSLVIAFIITLVIQLQPSLLRWVPKQIAFILGFYNESYSSVDHFPIFPWSILYLMGIILGKVRYTMGPLMMNTVIKTFFNYTLIPIGKYSLEIYMFHWFALYILFYGVSSFKRL